jgi:hypothetical protein
VIEDHRPRGRADDPVAWMDETSTAPYVVYVLQKEQK